jgi:hypothetical protein
MTGWFTQHGTGERAIAAGLAGGIRNGKPRDQLVDYLVVLFGRDTISTILPSSSSGA